MTVPKFIMEYQIDSIFESIKKSLLELSEDNLNKAFLHYMLNTTILKIYFTNERSIRLPTDFDIQFAHMVAFIEHMDIPDDVVDSIDQITNDPPKENKKSESLIGTVIHKLTRWSNKE